MSFVVIIFQLVQTASSSHSNSEKKIYIVCGQSILNSIYPQKYAIKTYSGETSIFE